MTSRTALLLASLAGGGLALGQAPWDLWWLAIASLAAGVFIVAQAPRPVLATWLMGSAYFALALHWIVEPFFVDAAATAWLAPFALTGLAGGLALFWAFGGLFAARFAPRRPLALACMLLLAEWLRGMVLTGFPWAQPGQMLGLFFPWTYHVGPLGLSAAVFLIAGGAAQLCPRLHRWQNMTALAALAAACGALIQWAPLAPPPAPDAPVVRIVHTGAPQHQKWDPALVPGFFEAALAASRTEAATQTQSPALVLWPETSLPVLVENSQPARAMIAQAAGAPVFLGAQRYDAEGHPRNTALLIDATGEILAQYDKHHLVPFGEYLPAPALFERLGIGPLASALAGRYAPGPGPGLIDLPGIGAGFPMICYEAIFPGYVREQARPRVLLHLSNDAWFGQHAGPQQHLRIARLRAAELGVPLLRATNTGISAVIDARGRVVVAAQGLRWQGIAAPLPTALAPGFYAQTGDWPVLLVIIFTLIVGVIWPRRANPH